MAGHTSRAGQAVVIVDVTIGAGAWWDRMQSGERETGAVVIKRGIQPGAGAMALLAGLRKIRVDVVGIGRALEVLQMTGHAGRAGQVVVIVNVAIGACARRDRVQAGEREPGGVVIKCGIQPTASGMTLLAGLRKIRVDVVGIGRALEVLQVTGHAGRAGQVVVIVNVTIRARAWRDSMQSGKRESGTVVIKRCIQPTASGMTLLAGLRKI